MKPHVVDRALPGLFVLMALAFVLFSATGGERVTVVLLSIILSVAVIVLGSVFVLSRRHVLRSVLPAFVGASFSLGIIISVAASDWPLHAAYACSRGSFEAVAQRVRDGEIIATPLRAGLFKIRRAELSRRGIVCLWTHPDPGGNAGFVQCPREDMPFNLWSIVRLDDHWQFIQED